jgi:hypothetical protein
VIFGRMREAREEVEEAPGVVCSVRMVVLWAMQALGGVSRWCVREEEEKDKKRKGRWIVSGKSVSRQREDSSTY